ncbi:MAG: sulfotransferase [Spongiibacteraceae bacterium]
MNKINKNKELEFRSAPGEVRRLTPLDQAMRCGHVARAAFNFVGAEYCFKQIAEIFPRETGPLLQWLGVAVLLGDDEVVNYLVKRLEKLKIKPAELLPSLAEYALQEGDSAAALEHIRRLLLLSPTNDQAGFLLAQTYKALGENRQAVEAYDRLIERSPHHAQPYYQRGLILKTDLTERQKQQLDCALAAVNEDDLHASAWLNLAKAWSLQGEVEEEFNYLDRVKLRYAAQFQFNSNFFDERFRAPVAYCTSARLREAAALSVGSDEPIFIAAMGRSGTTLVEAILGAHKDFVAAGERNVIQTAVDRVGHGFNKCGSVWEWGYSVPLDKLMHGTQGYISKHNAIKRASGKRWIDKSLDNVTYMGLAKMIYPRAKFIHVKRNPMAVCLSNYQHHMGYGSTVPFSLEQLAYKYRAIERAIEHWQTLFGDDILVLEYESLVADFVGTVQKLVGFLGADWDEACLRFNEQKNVVLTPSTMAVRSPVNAEAEKKWMKYEKHLQPVAKVLNL